MAGSEKRTPNCRALGQTDKTFTHPLSPAKFYHILEKGTTEKEVTQ